MARAAALLLLVLIVAVCADVRRGVPTHARRNAGPRDKYVPWTVRDALPSTAVVPLQYPLYQQCDPIWGGDFMNGSASPDCRASGLNPPLQIRPLTLCAPRVVP